MIFKIRVDDKTLAHTTFRLFAGPHEGAVGLCGRLTMRNDEFEEFKRRIEAQEAEPIECDECPFYQEGKCDYRGGEVLIRKKGRPGVPVVFRCYAKGAQRYLSVKLAEQLMERYHLKVEKRILRSLSDKQLKKIPKITKEEMERRKSEKKER